MKKVWANRNGFTIIELLVVIVIIGIIATVSAVMYNGVQTRSRMTKIETDITSVQKLVEAYHARNGSYPLTAANLNPNGSTATARTDSNCTIGAHMAEWVPSLSVALPQSAVTTAVGNYPGCYMYASDGTNYILSAWNMVRDAQTDTMYRRLGFREMDAAHTNNQFYLCNNSTVGGVSGSYNINNDYYKHSLTVSSITSCNETPPAGA